MRKQITLYFDDEEFKFLDNKKNKSKYIRDLLRKEIDDEPSLLIKKIDLINLKQEELEKQKEELIKKIKEVKQK